MKKRMAGIVLLLICMAVLRNVSAEDMQHAETLHLNTDTEVTISLEGEKIWFSFIPDATGMYSFYSENYDDLDPMGELYDEKGVSLASNDDSDKYSLNTLNFAVEHILNAGQKYYFSAGLWGENTGTFTVQLKRMNLTVSTVGGTYRIVDYGARVTLEVDAAAESGGITYQWMKNGIEIEGATAKNYVIDSFIEAQTSYVCRVSSGSEEIMAEYLISFDNHLHAEPDASMKTDEYTGSVNVRQGDQAVLKVNASCDKGELHYVWLYSDGSILPDSEDAPELKTMSYDENTTTEIWCNIRDEYSNSIDILFRVFSDNHLTASRKGEKKRSVLIYQDTTLEVEASCTFGGLSYQWYRTEGENRYILEGENSPELQLKEVKQKGTYACKITDEYTHEKWLDFEVIADNQFIAQAVGGNYRNVVPGSSLQLEVQVSLLEGSCHFIWIDDEQILGNGPSVTLENLTASKNILCDCRDDFGNTAVIQFVIEANHLIQASTATAFSLGWKETARLGVTPASGTGLSVNQLNYSWQYKYEDMDEFQPVQDGGSSNVYTTWQMDRNMMFACRAYQTGNEGNAEWVYFSMNVASRPATPGDLQISEKFENKEINMYYHLSTSKANVSSTIDTFRLENKDQLKTELAGDPVWTIEIKEGVQNQAKLKVTEEDVKLEMETPIREGEAKYVVKCIWDTAVWEKEITVHYMDLSGNSPDGVEHISGTDFWKETVGSSFYPQNVLRFRNNWNPAGGEAVAVQLYAEAQTGLTIHPKTFRVQLSAPGVFNAEVKLSFANIEWTEPVQIFVTGENGTVPAGNYQIPEENKTVLPAGIKRIEAEALRGISSETIVIPEGCEEIEAYAFADNDQLKTIILPSTIVRIDEKAFDGCGSIVAVTNSESMVQFAKNQGMIVLTE